MTQPASNDAPLIVSVSGIRGIVGKSLTPQVVGDFAACYGTDRSGGTVVVSYDGRNTGPMLKHAAIAGLLSVGCRVVDLGIAATPTCGYYIKSIKAAGGIQITASHNPPEYNGLKLYRPEGFVLGPAEGQRIADAYRARRQSPVAWDRILDLQTVADPHLAHLERVLSLVEVAAIKARRFHVVFDANHGSGGVFGPRLLEALGCRVEVRGGVSDGRFEHPPEPTEENLTSLCDAVKHTGADLGFAVDPDADRLALVDNLGRYIGEEYTLALSILHRTGQQRGPVAINGSTSRLSEDAAKRNGCSVFRTKVGEVHVAEKMIAENCILGGEGNGGVIDPRVGQGRDSAIGMALILEMLANSKTNLADLVATLPRYAICKQKYPVFGHNLQSVLDGVAVHFADGAVDRSDGIRVDWPDAWVQLRASNTEPIVRVIAEATNSSRAAQLCDEVGRLLGK